MKDNPGSNKEKRTFEVSLIPCCWPNRKQDCAGGGRKHNARADALPEKHVCCLPAICIDCCSIWLLNVCGGTREDGEKGCSWPAAVPGSQLARMPEWLCSELTEKLSSPGQGFRHLLQP